MAAPVITWKKHASVADVAGSTITVLSLGTVTAGQWSINKCVSVYVGTTAVSNLKMWLADSYAIVNGSPVSLGATGKEWEFMAMTAQATLTGLTASFSGDGSSLLVTLAADFRAGTNNSVGAGLSLGGSTNSSVALNTRSNVTFLSTQPNASAYDGEHTQFGFQVGYDFT